MRSSLPINASSCVHFALGFCVSVKSSCTSLSSNFSTSCLPSLLKLTLARRLS
ncbi:hypothetical protein BAZSYMB_GCONTIG00858_1 [Bathymodiolus azoricus thioautotrophic gill symbiont]|uniref:Uncharacterized protein n=1 Tax=Bathymodiolus azoricus thioautotrophic gill symbiont TaxID=235205 RepID=A0A1H6K504_9GAMM|nr:hypothetical protein BAZSYMB_GCONTIG00858_1 [Bathymodiolus azoricus thioautotrophic gill symbiont]